MASLELRNISKNFGATQILLDISLALADGEFLVLVGPSGCGKSTLMNIIAGLEEPSRGNVLLNGADITERAPAERDVSMVFQSYALYPNMTVARNIEFPLRMRKVGREGREARVRDVAKLLQIEHLLQRKPRQLSGGQRQRVAIGRALAREPRLYLFDEPLSNLDAQLRLDMRTEIKKLHQRLGATIVYVTHDQIEAMTLATRIAVMKGGVVQQLGTPHQVYNRPANVFVASFMGSPRMNLLPARVTGAPGALALEVKNNDHPGLCLELPAHAPEIEAYLGRELIAGLRAEAVSLAGAVGGGCEITARVVVVEPTGADTLALLDVGGHEFTARLEPEAAIEPGQERRFRVELAKLVCFDSQTEQLIA
jgi:multiple sugar transport system ATP-binding protein